MTTMTMMKSLLLVLAAALLSAIHARPTYRLRIPNGARVPCQDNVPGCSSGTCSAVGHNSCKGPDYSSQTTSILNPFGSDFRAAGFQWTQSLCMKDSDGDGFTNGEELGDPCCDWTPDSFLEHMYAFGHPGFSTDYKDESAPPKCKRTSPVTPAPSFSFFLENEDERTRQYHIPNYTLPGKQTIYEDFFWSFDDAACRDGSCFLLGLEAIVDKAEMLHHYVLYACSRMPRGSSSSFGQGWGYCSTWLGGWAPGADTFFKADANASPKLANLNGKPVVGFRLNVHYSNDDLQSGVVDASGFKMHYTTQPREHVMSFFAPMMLNVNTDVRVPRNHERYFITSGCFIEGLESDIHVSGLFYHAHLLGKEMYTELFTQNFTKRTDIHAADSWIFDDQSILKISDTVIKNGDYIQSSCLYDSRERSDMTIIGPETTDEMCWAFLYFYPVQQKIRCARHSSFIWTGDLKREEKGSDVVDNYPVPALQHLRPPSTTKGFKLALDIGSIFGGGGHCYKEDLPLGITSSDLTATLFECFAQDRFFEASCIRTAHALATCSCPGNADGVLTPSEKQAIDGAYAMIEGLLRNVPQLGDRCAIREAYETSVVLQEQDCSKCSSCAPCEGRDVSTGPCASCRRGSCAVCGGYTGKDAYVDFSPPREPETKTPTDDEKAGTGAIIGGSLGGAVLIVAAALIFIRSSRKKQQNSSLMEAQMMSLSPKSGAAPSAPHQSTELVHV